MIVLENRRALKQELECMWTRLNDLKVANFYIKENRDLVLDAKNLVNNPDRIAVLKNSWKV